MRPHTVCHILILAALTLLTATLALAQDVPVTSERASPSTSQTAPTTENNPAQPATPASPPSIPQTQQAPDSVPVPPAPAPPTANTTKAKPKRHHVSGFDIGIIVASVYLLFVLTHMDG